MPPRITDQELEELRQHFEPLVGLRIDWVSIPAQALAGFEPSQIAVIVNTVLDAALPQITLFDSEPDNREKLANIRLLKAPRQIGQREAYPDYAHPSGKRLELKGLFVDTPSLGLRRPPTKREPSARLKENVTIDVVEPTNDVLLIAAIQLQQGADDRCYPFIVDIGLFSMIESIEARDNRLKAAGGKWIDGVPKVVSKEGARKLGAGLPLMDEDYEKDTNFGKLKRIPYPPLMKFLQKHGALKAK